MPNNDFEHQIDALTQKIEKTNPTYHKDETRRKFALYFLGGYFSLLIIVLVFIFLYNKFVIIDALDKGIEGIIPTQLVDLERVFFLLTSAFGSTLGFIIGYYFKDEKS